MAYALVRAVSAIMPRPTSRQPPRQASAGVPTRHANWFATAYRSLPARAAHAAAESKGGAAFLTLPRASAGNGFRSYTG